MCSKTAVKKQEIDWTTKVRLMVAAITKLASAIYNVVKVIDAWDALSAA